MPRTKTVILHRAYLSKLGDDLPLAYAQQMLTGVGWLTDALARGYNLS